MLDDLGLADGQPLGVARAAQQHGQLLALDALLGAAPEPPFLEHHAALLVDLGLAQRRAAREVRERGEAAVEQRVAIGGHLEHVDGLVERCVGVGVGAEAKPDRLQIGDQLVGLEVLGAVEIHVLGEMGEPPLVVGFEVGPRLDRELQRCASLGPQVPLDEVAQPVREHPAMHRGIEAQ